MEFLCEYYFEVKYIQGKDNVVADAFSCRRHEISAVSLGVDLRGQIVATLPIDTWYQDVRSEVESSRDLEGRFAD